jgi:hypothetical protein
MPTGKFDQPKPVWICSKCRQAVPDTLDACWNCGTTRDGFPNPTFVKSEPPEPGCEPAAKETVAPEIKCARCGSAKVIPNAPTQAYLQPLMVAVDGNPLALFYKDRLLGEVTADICGDCGHVELHVSNGPQLYERYLCSLRQSDSVKKPNS